MYVYLILCTWVNVTLVCKVGRHSDLMGAVSKRLSFKITTCAKLSSCKITCVQNIQISKDASLKTSYKKLQIKRHECFETWLFCNLYVLRHRYFATWMFWEIKPKWQTIVLINKEYRIARRGNDYNSMVSIRYVGLRDIADRSRDVEDSRRKISLSFSSSSRSSSKDTARLISVCPRARDFQASSLMTWEH